MAEERTEAEALAQVLTISVGGEPVALRTLTIDESDAWLRRLTGAVDVELAEAEGDADTLARMLALPAQAALDLVAAYDVDGVLGDVGVPPDPDDEARAPRRPWRRWRMPRTLSGRAPPVWRPRCLGHRRASSRR